MSLSVYLSKDTVRCGVCAENWEQAVEAAAQPLLEQTVIEESYCRRCIETIKKEGPYMVLTKGIALVHARPGEDVHREAVSLISLQQPLNFGHKENDPVKLVFFLAAQNNQSHIGVLMDLAQKLSEAGKKEELLQIEDASLLYEQVV